MFSTISITAFAMGLICTVSGLDAGPKDPYEALINCGQAALEEDADDLKVKGGHWNSPEEKIDESCVALGLYGRCLLNKVDTSSSVPDAVLFHFANSWLHMVISEKAGLCENQNLPREEMKTIVLASGILKRENLPNVEEVDYEECAGAAFRKCTVDGMTRFEGGDDKNFVISLKKYHQCFRHQAKTCHAKLLQDFVVYINAFERHFEESQGKLEKMAEKMPLPHMEL